MRNTSLFVLILLIFTSLQAECPRKKGKKKISKQLDEVVITPQNFITSYKASYRKFFDLEHTKLTIKPVFKEKKLYGLAEITLKPHFYDQNELILDAKWMKINSVELKTPAGNKKLNYTYDTLKLKIDLGKTFTRNDDVNVLIDYVAQPYMEDSAQVEDGRGMYFIDVEDKNPYKPPHLWTQGEEESNSCWFPTLDATNQKTTEEIFVTIDNNLVSLSNGLLLDTKNNADGTKTDHWKQDKLHAPYLFFLAVGDYYKYVDKWRDKEVSAYTFPKYKDAVGEVFKSLPEMMEFFSKKLGVDFVWDKLANIMAYDYTAGAMENTSAIIYYEKLLCYHQQLIDDNFDWIVSHELFHQWFGDLVTTESWANLTLNESMADYSEYLWMEYKYGKDEADAYNLNSRGKYIHSSKFKNEPIINYYYDKPQDEFDDIRYEKGGRVLHMLRNYIGDEAFFKSLNKYLVDNKFKSAELSDLRKAFEEVTGEDLNWFFNQWWLNKGHPILDITHKYNEKNETIELTVRQTQTDAEAPTFRIPTKVDIYINGKKETKSIDVTDRVMTFYFPAASAPQLVNFDADKVLLCEKTEDLSEAENIFKFYNAPLYEDRLEALDALTYRQKDNPAVQGVFLKALQDKNWNLRIEAIADIDADKYADRTQVSLAIQKIINTDGRSQVREKAVNKIAKIEKDKSAGILENVINKDSSYITIAAALNNLHTYNKNKSYDYAVKLSSMESTEIMAIIGKIFKDTTADNLEFYKKAIWLNTARTFYSNFKSIGEYLEIADTGILQKGVMFLKDIYQYEESSYNTLGAKQVIKNLKYYFEDKAKKDKQADIKLQIVNKIAFDLFN
ncbi:MAG: Peptidase rane alanine aminopeptidase [Bacteroidota bacterium]|nr:Peptidase rane alanine aminopeptidase [Bacteroidota bacterium]